MQMLEAGGATLLTDENRLPDEDNPKGYLEFEPVKHLRSNKEWLPLAKGKVVKVIHALMSRKSLQVKQKCCNVQDALVLI